MTKSFFERAPSQLFKPKILQIGIFWHCEVQFFCEIS